MISFKFLDISKYQKKIKEKTTFLIDIAASEIPAEPLLISYINPKLPVRIMAKETLIGLNDQREKMKDKIHCCEIDVSEIAVALEETDNLDNTKNLYKSILNKMLLQGLNKAEIYQKCLSIEEIMESFQPSNNFEMDVEGFEMSDENFEMGDEDFQKLEFFLDEFSQMIRISNQPTDLDQELPTLINFFEEMILSQSSIISEAKNKLASLPDNNVICPVTREKMLVQASFDSQKKAENFLSLFIALSKLAKTEDSSIESFLVSSPDYLTKANACLKEYIIDPNKFAFTKSQREFLNDIGMIEVIEYAKLPSRYKHLWHDSRSEVENALAMFIDYNKQDWFFPKLGLFFCGHLRRHHPVAVATAIEQLQEGKSLDEVLLNLESSAKKHPSFNERGSLMCRIQFIRSQCFADGVELEVSERVAHNSKCVF